MGDPYQNLLGIYNERAFKLPAAERFHEVARAAIAHWQLRLFVVCRLSDAQELKLLVDLRRHPNLHARGPDHHWHSAGDALCPAR